MLALAGLAWTFSYAPIQDTERYTFKNVSATYIISRISGFENKAPGEGEGLIPDSLKVTIDVPTNSVILKGPAEDRENAKRVFALFDVRAVRVEMEVDGYLPLFDYHFKNIVTVANNSRWEIHEPNVELDLELVPRVNDDGTCTVSVRQVYLGKGQKLIARAKIGDSVEAKKGILEVKQDLNESTNRPPFDLKIRFIRVIRETRASDKP